jgi:hypothetical protein
MFVFIGLLVGTSLVIVARAFRTGSVAAVPIGWAVLVINEGVVGVTDEFPYPYGMALVYVIFFVSLIGALVLTLAMVRSLINVAPPVRLEPSLVKRIGILAYRLVFPAFLSMPLVWMMLNQLRRLSYPFNGGEPNEFHGLVIAAQNYVWWMLLLLVPFVCGVTIHSLTRRKRPALTA